MRLYRIAFSEVMKLHVCDLNYKPCMDIGDYMHEFN